MSKSNIVLIGFPGVGKSTAGVILAKVAGYEFVDSDLVIQKTTGKLLHEIIEDNGVEGFIKVEEDVNASLDVTNSVIATGGSVVYGAKAMKQLSEIGTIVYLKVAYDIISKRLSDIKGRGVVLREGQTLESLYEERTVLYEKYADVIIDEAHLSIEETVAKIIAAIGDK